MDNEQIKTFIEQATEAQQEILYFLHNKIVQLNPQIEQQFKWSRPVYALKGKDLLYLQKAKAYITLGFMQAGKLEDPENKLEGTGKDMRHVKIKNMTQAQDPLFQSWIQALIQ